jgi:hypothetical protein
MTKFVFLIIFLSISCCLVQADVGDHFFDDIEKVNQFKVSSAGGRGISSSSSCTSNMFYMVISEDSYYYDWLELNIIYRVELKSLISGFADAIKNCLKNVYFKVRTFKYVTGNSTSTIQI